MSMREMTYGEAVKEAMAEEMRRDPTVFLMGEDVGKAGTVFKVLLGLHDEFGDDRVIDTPIAEAGLVGLGVGAALTGSRPIVDIMFGDFITLAMDQIVNQAAKLRYNVRRSGHRAHHHPLHNGRRTLLCRTAFAELTRLARAHPRPQSRHSLHTRRRQGPLQNRR